MTEAQQRRLFAYLEALKPHVLALRQQGWPVELNLWPISTAHRPMVMLTLDVDDTRTPVEATDPLAPSPLEQAAHEADTEAGT